MVFSSPDCLHSSASCRTCGDGVVALGSGDDALGPGEADAGREDVGLHDRRRFDETELVGVRDHRRHAVVAQTAGVDARRDEVVAQGVHLEERRELGGVAVVEGVDALGHGRAGGRLDRDDAGLLALLDVLAHEREGDAGEVGAATDARHDEVGIGAGQLHLLEGFLADDRLVEHDVVEHRAERVVRVVALSGDFDRLADGDAQAARGIGIGGQDGAAAVGGVGRAGDDFRAPHADHAAAIGLLEVGDLHHVDQAFHAEELAGQRERGAPLAGAGLGGQLGDAFLLVVPGLGQWRCWACASRPG